MADLVRAHILVSGEVQGVSFRQAAVDEARRLGLRGWVRNVADGRVEAEAEGERAKVEALVRWCGRGPPAARVGDVQVSWRAHGGDLGPFAVRR
ncbi:acylphosphatase [Anaeromyxobacter terrae]|uniref:acylphosphatase n=1 Tax=Anaeromyxobacter terrae TaxID=2925406 RepID=UPI001F5AE8A0|nr:acylphosphatase [Anaeromyxobacter sp. SG22]